MTFANLNSGNPSKARATGIPMITNQFQHMIMAQQPYAMAQQGYFPNDSPPLMEPSLEMSLDSGKSQDTSSAAVCPSSPVSNSHSDNFRSQRRV